MMPAIGDDDLNAYVDGALDPVRALGIAAYLAAHPRDAARAEAYRMQRDWLHALLDHVLVQPVPSRLRAVPRRRERRLAWLRRAWAMAAFVMALAALALGGRALQARFARFDAVLSAPAQDVPAARPQRGSFIRI